MNEINLKNKTVLITGGTGSFGSTFLKKLIKTNVQNIKILSRDELKQYDQRTKINDPRISYFLGDVRDRDSLKYVFNSVDYVFHAAALKQVPSCEFQPEEAFKTNLIGSKNVIEACIDCGVSKAVFLSTDKAVNPINAMGMTKALMEKLVSSYSKKANNKTKLVITRYGNVMFSRGSVIPTWINSIKKNIPILITDPDMTRFLMSLSDCHKLVFYAFKNGKTGDIFVQKSKSTDLNTLVKALEKILGKKAKTKIIGPREGEKVHEVLISEYEMPNAKENNNFFKIPNVNNKLNHSNFFDKGDLTKKRKFLEFSSKDKIMSLEEVIKTLIQSNEIKEHI
jgi:UDP-glucose 4-epimerase